MPPHEMRSLQEWPKHFPSHLPQARPGAPSKGPLRACAVRSVRFPQGAKPLLEDFDRSKNYRIRGVPFQRRTGTVSASRWYRFSVPPWYRFSVDKSFEITTYQQPPALHPFSYFGGAGSFFTEGLAVTTGRLVGSTRSPPVTLSSFSPG